MYFASVNFCHDREEMFADGKEESSSIRPARWIDGDWNGSPGFHPLVSAEVCCPKLARALRILPTPSEGGATVREMIARRDCLRSRTRPADPAMPDEPSVLMNHCVQDMSQEE